jgi:hypothetical protein
LGVGRTATQSTAALRRVLDDSATGHVRPAVAAQQAAGRSRRFLGELGDNDDLDEALAVQVLSSRASTDTSR